MHTCFFLNSLGVVHRDLKLDNILLHGNIDNCDIKIADFGLSALVRLDENGYDAEESKKRKGMYVFMDVYFVVYMYGCMYVSMYVYV